jgi:hypothetical protein
MGSSTQSLAPSGDQEREPEIRVVLDYLAHCEAGRLDEARAYLAAGVKHTFPGGRIFADLGDWFGYFRSRIDVVRKRHQQVDVCRTGDPDDAAVVVYVRGLLEGRTVEGVSFDDVRFIDRFVVRDGAIVDQQVWNDLASRGIEPTPIPADASEESWTSSRGMTC